MDKKPDTAWIILHLACALTGLGLVASGVVAPIVAVATGDTSEFALLIIMCVVMAICGAGFVHMSTSELRTQLRDARARRAAEKRTALV